MAITGKDVAERWEKRDVRPLGRAKPVRMHHGTRCEEASVLSRETFIPCSQPAVTLVDNGDQRMYWMCGACAIHNVENRRGRLVAWKHDDEE